MVLVRSEDDGDIMRVKVNGGDGVVISDSYAVRDLAVHTFAKATLAEKEGW